MSGIKNSTVGRQTFQCYYNYMYAICICCIVALLIHVVKVAICFIEYASIAGLH